MKVEHPNALRFLLQEELYLLDEDKGLYNNTLKPEPQIETPRPVFNYIGNNKKNFLILVHYPGHDFIPDEHLTALANILGRKGHTREDVVILNLAKNPMEYELISVQFSPKTLLILGERSIPSGLKKPQFNLCEKQGDANVLYTFAFDDMMTNVENKKAFWEQMKSL